MTMYMVFKQNKQHHIFLLYVISTVVLLCASVSAVCFGSVHINLNTIVHSILNGTSSSVQSRILLLVRIPRVAAALCAGSAFAVSGVLIQTALHNPLAGPSIIGVNSGALFMAVLCVTVFPQLSMLLPIAAFSGALIAMILVYTAAAYTGSTSYTIVLAGIAISAFISAGTDTLTVLYPESLPGGLSFRTGSLSGITLPVLIPAGSLITTAILISILLHNQLDVLSLGDEIALSLGLSIKRMRFIFLLLAALLSGSAVSFGGLIGFVGLVVPHAVRLIAGNESIHTLSLSAICGAALVTICDVIARTAFSPNEIPVGIILSFIGGPFFIYLLFKHRGHTSHD